MGNTFSVLLLGGGVDAMEREFGYGRTSALCCPSALSHLTLSVPYKVRTLAAISAGVSKKRPQRAVISVSFISEIWSGRCDSNARP
jgi:hypothetical protein